MLFLQILIILLATKLAGELSVRLGQPAVLGKLIVGIIIGPAVFGLIEKTEMIEQISEIGVLLLMFIAGLETNIKDLNQNLKSSIAVAFGGVILPLLGGYVTGVVLGLPFEHAMFIGLLISATSVSITVQTFKELGQLKSKESTTILGAALIDDVLVVVSLAIMMSLLTAQKISISLLIGKKLLFFFIIVLVGWKVVPFIMKKLAPLRVSEAVISSALIVCFFFAYIAELLGIAGIIGAFAAGIAISQTNFKSEVEQKIEPIAYAFFVPVFFVNIGLSVSFAGIQNHIWIIVLLTIVAILTKIIGSGIGARLTGFNLKSSFGIGVGMVSRGEVALILGSIGLEANLLRNDYFTTVIVVVILTTLFTPPMLKKIFSK